MEGGLKDKGYDLKIMLQMIRKTAFLRLLIFVFFIFRLRSAWSPSSSHLSWYFYITSQFGVMIWWPCNYIKKIPRRAILSLFFSFSFISSKFYAIKLQTPLGFKHGLSEYKESTLTTTTSPKQLPTYIPSRYVDGWDRKRKDCILWRIK